MQIFQSLKEAVGAVSAGVAALQAGKQLLDDGGDAIEQALWAKKLACDAIAADAAVAKGIDHLVELYEEVARLCLVAENLATDRVDGVGAIAGALGGLPGLADPCRGRAAAMQQARSLLNRSTAAPEAPDLAPEEWHAAWVLLPVKSASAQLGLGPHIGAPPSDGANCSLARIICGNSCYNISHDLDESSRVEDILSQPSSVVWPLHEDSFDSIHFPPLFLQSPSDLDFDQNGPQDLLSQPLLRHPSLIEEAASLPAANAPTQAPAMRSHLQGATVGQIRLALKSQPWPLEEFFQEYSEAHDFVSSEWQDEARIPGTEVRGLRYTIPMPPDAAAYSGLESTSVTAVFRLRACEDEIVLLMQSVTHDVPFGRNFRTQETLHFREDGQGVVLTKWAEVVWVEPLSWTMSVLAKIIEAKAVSAMRESFPTFVRVLLNACAAKCVS